MSEFDILPLGKSSFKVNFSSITLAKAILKSEFASSLLCKLAPDFTGNWKPVSNPRINAFIKGFPSYLSWSLSDKTLTVDSTKNISQEYYEDLKKAIKGFIGHKENEFSKTVYRFQIVDIESKKTYSYEFYNRARALVAFCVLWDGEEHPRDHLEVKINEEKSYGDPSKTVDELRNEGFPRLTDQSSSGVYIKVTRQKKYGAHQEHYQLVNKNQSLVDRVGRSNIPSSYKRKLYEKSNYSCSVCGNKYEGEYLAPDHRVPSIVEQDNLSPLNYLEKLQTLCVRCNQVKREACKKCPYNHDCINCEWAYPENKSLSVDNIKRLREISEECNISVNELVFSKIISKY